jgi:hypothetical protein
MSNTPFNKRSLDGNKIKVQHLNHSFIFFEREIKIYSTSTHALYYVLLHRKMVLALRTTTASFSIHVHTVQQSIID